MDKVIPYLDDIIVSVPSFQQLLQRLGEVFKHMGTMDIKLNISKCHIGQIEIKFLGHIVSKEGFRPDAGNIEAVTQMKAPTNLKEVRRLIGMVGFYRKHLPNFSKIASPLTDLTRKNQAFKWTVECQQAFEELKTLLIKAPILAKAKLYKQFILETDASQRHVAAALLQYDEEGLPRTIGYYSQKLKPAEVRYATTDREALAVVMACRHFNHCFGGSKFTIRTDHQVITTVFKQRTKSPSMSKWILEMRDYHYKEEFELVKKNVVADELSRPVRIIREEETLNWLGRSKEEIRGMQRAEPRWQEMIHYLEGDRVP